MMKSQIWRKIFKNPKPFPERKKDFCCGIFCGSPLFPTLLITFISASVKINC